MNQDETYIVTHIIPEYYILDALQLPEREQFESLRKRIVLAQRGGVNGEEPAWQTFGGKITLFDMPGWNNPRSYSIPHCVRLALAHLTLFPLGRAGEASRSALLSRNSPP
jgi:hypothetical protein